MTATGAITALCILSVTLSLVMTVAWCVWRWSGNSGWIDTIWTFGLGTLGLGSALLASGGSTRGMIVGSLIVLWSLRLGLHIACRTAGIVDDPRYAALAKDWGQDASRQMFWLLQKQALVSIPLALSMVLAAANPQPEIRLQDIFAIVIFAVAIGGEAIADEQLRSFRSKADNKGSVCETGLWKWSRHPNYFFEWLGWIAYPLFAIDLSGGYPWGFAALIGPICMYWLLVYVSGIPPLEEHMLNRHGEKFRDYQSKTSAFFPLPARNVRTAL
jgi:steroid 5-alpha reductase family enzyme